MEIPKLQQIVIHESGVSTLCVITGDPTKSLAELAQEGNIKVVKILEEIPNDNNNSSGRG